MLGFFLPQGTFKQFLELRGPLSSSQKLLRMDLGLRVSTDGLAAGPEHRGQRWALVERAVVFPAAK